jgi:molybdate transport system substrate-binding protein
VRAFVVAGLCLFLLPACARGGDRPVELVVSAAASLAEVMRDAAQQYAREVPDVVVRNNFGASGTLEQQIRQGAGVDVFVPAGEREMDALAEVGLVDLRTRRDLARNELVLVVPEGSRVTGFRDLAAPGVERVAMGAPASVPAGRYARAALESLGLWPDVSPKVVYAADVRQALAYAERGEVDAALVYRTDALAGRRVRVVAAAPPSSHAPIVYPAAGVAASEHPAAARRYLDFLAGPHGAEIFRRYGFSVPRDGG